MMNFHFNFENPIKLSAGRTRKLITVSVHFLHATKHDNRTLMNDDRLSNEQRKGFFIR